MDKSVALKLVLTMAREYLDEGRDTTAECERQQEAIDIVAKFNDYDYVPLSQKECDHIWYSPTNWTTKLRSAHKLGWDAAMKAKP